MTEQAQTSKPQQGKIKAFFGQFYVGPAEVLYLVGLAAILAGLWVWLGFGQALFFCGCLLVATAFVSAMERRNNVV